MCVCRCWFVIQCWRNRIDVVVSITKHVFSIEIMPNKLFRNIIKSFKSRFGQKCILLSTFVTHFEKNRAVSPTLGHNLKIGVRGANYDANFDIKTMAIGSGVEAGQHSKGRWCIILSKTVQSQRVDLLKQTLYQRLQARLLLCKFETCSQNLKMLPQLT